MERQQLGSLRSLVEVPGTGRRTFQRSPPVTVTCHAPWVTGRFACRVLLDPSPFLGQQSSSLPGGSFHEAVVLLKHQIRPCLVDGLVQRVVDTLQPVDTHINLRTSRSQPHERPSLRAGHLLVGFHGSSGNGPQSRTRLKLRRRETAKHPAHSHHRSPWASTEVPWPSLQVASMSWQSRTCPCLGLHGRRLPLGLHGRRLPLRLHGRRLPLRLHGRRLPLRLPSCAAILIVAKFNARI